MVRFGKWLVPVGLGLLAIAGTTFVWQVFFFRHQHCISATEIALVGYASDHSGKFPSSPKGFGDALLILIKEKYLEDGRVLVEPGDDDRVYQQGLVSGDDVDEQKCSRIYIQGLSQNSVGNVALLFDRDSCPGGDHFRRLWGPRVREVASTTSGMSTVSDEDWPAFAKGQIRLLIENGIPHDVAESYYLMTGLTSAQIMAASSSPPASSPRATH